MRPQRKVQEGPMADRDVINTPPEHKPPRTSHLVGRYKFGDYNSAVDFFNGIVKFTNSENVGRQSHHLLCILNNQSRLCSITLVY